MGDVFGMDFTETPVCDQSEGLNCVLPLFDDIYHLLLNVNLDLTVMKLSGSAVCFEVTAILLNKPREGFQIFIVTLDNSRASQMSAYVAC